MSAVDQMTVEELSAWVNEHVLGEARPVIAGRNRYAPYSNGGNWYWSAQGWEPLPASGNQMMRVVRAMAERGWPLYQLLSQGDGSYHTNFRCKPNLAVYRGADNNAAVATYRAAAKAVEGEEK